MLKNLIFVLLLFPVVLSAQSPKVGVRAGLDFSKFIGPLESGESYGYSNGFHFGINYSYPFTSIVGVTAELVYQQKGTQRKFEGLGYYHGFDGLDPYFEEGEVDMLLNISNAYISLPLSVYLKPFKKFELFAGVSFDFLINPLGTGLLNFTSTNAPDDFFFEQSLNYQYYEDDPRGVKTSLYAPQVFRGDDIVVIPGAVGAYYHLDAEYDKEELFPWFNMSLLTGATYYIRKSFYISGRAELGLFDQTNDVVDISLSEYNGDKFVFREDKDVHLGFQVSLGFKF